MEIEIISAPVGPAPEEVREAWVGLILSVGGLFFLPPCLCPCWIDYIDTIEEARKLAFMNVEKDDLPAFLVPIIPAMQKLAAKNENAVRWWENRWEEQGRIMGEFDFFFFRKDACRIV